MPDSRMTLLKASEPKQRADSPSARISDLRPIIFPASGIDSSAGGFEAYNKLLDAFRPPSGAAFIMVQHLGPTHESLMADLLAGLR